MTDPAVQIIILNWNGRDLTLDCLDSLRKITYPNVDILVVDNGSTDDSVVAITTKYPGCTMLPLDNNYGYAGGNNRGFDSLGGAAPEFVIFLNNDTIVEPDFIEPLIRPLEQNQSIGQTAPKINYADNPSRIWYAGGNINLWTGMIKHTGIRDTDGENYSSDNFTDYATGCCFCMRSDEFRALNGFDTSYPMYSEDADLSLRLRGKNKKVLFVAESKIYHKVSASIGGAFSKAKLKRKFTAYIRLFLKHANPIQWLTIILYSPIHLIRVIILYLLARK